MTTRRSLLSRVVGLGIGGFLTGGVNTSAARSPESGGSTTGSSGGKPGSKAGTADTALIATVEGGVLHATGLPEPAGAVLTEAFDRRSALSLADVGRATGSATLDRAGITAGSAVVEGSFDESAIAAELRHQGFSDVGVDRGYDGSESTASGETSARRFVASGASYAVSVRSSSITIECAGTVDEALSAIDGSFDPGRYRTPGTVDYGALPSLLDGDAVAYATLGSQLRTTLAETCSDGPDGLSSVLEVADAVGVGVRLDGDRTTVRYGIVGDRDRLTVGAVRDVVAQAVTDERSLSGRSITRQGRTVVAETVVPTVELWSAHGRLFGQTA